MIELSGVSKKYNEKVILENFSLNINDGDFIVITGKSGSGKSTILNLIGLLEKPTNGLIKIDGIDCVKLARSKRLKMYRYKISYLFQNYALIDNISVEENMKIAVKYLKISKKEKVELIDSALKKVGLSGLNKQDVFTLSGGEQQRLAIARLIVKPSDIILADEPTGNLDYENSNIIFKLLKEINMNDKKTVIVVSHSKDYIHYFDREIDISK